MKIIVGLGNPGKEYKGTRHSVGMFYLNKIAKSWDEKLEDRGGIAEITSYGSGKKKTWLIFPSELMNNSGSSLKKILGELKLKPKPEDILIIHDDLDIEIGRTKLSPAKSGAGHNGVISIEKSLKTKKFWRLRVGIAPKRKRNPTAGGPKDFLLAKFSPAEEKLIVKNSKKIIEGIDLWLENSSKAMNLINQK